MSLKIDKNIEIPSAPGGSGSKYLPAGQTWADVARAMNQGDSFELPADHTQKSSLGLRQSVMKNLQHATGKSCKFASRRTEAGFRFWRIS